MVEASGSGSIYLASGSGSGRPKTFGSGSLHTCMWIDRWLLTTCVGWLLTALALTYDCLQRVHWLTAGALKDDCLQQVYSQILTSLYWTAFLQSCESTNALTDCLWHVTWLIAYMGALTDAIACALTGCLQQMHWKMIAYSVCIERWLLTARALTDDCLERVHWQIACSRCFDRWLLTACALTDDCLQRVHLQIAYIVCIDRWLLRADALKDCLQKMHWQMVA